MTRTLLVLALACAALFALVRTREARTDERASGSTVLEPLVARSAQGDARPKVAAITISAPAREVEWLLARSKGRWRVREAFGAFADESAVQELLAALLDARGVVVSEAAAGDAARFGLAGDALVRIALHGPKVLEAEDKDVLAALELGARVPNASGAFARRAGDARVLELDRDPRVLVGSLARGELPPFVDRHLVAGSLVPGALALKRMTIARRGAAELVIEREDAAGAAQVRWSLRIGAAGGERRECPPWRAGGYMGAWLRGLAQGFEPASRAADVGCDAPYARVRLEPDEGEPIELAIADVLPDRRAYVWNKNTNVLMRIEGALQPLLAPAAEDFLDAARPNPWEAFLQSQAPREGR